MYSPASPNFTRQRNASLRDGILRELRESGKALTSEQLAVRVNGLDRTEVYAHVNFLREHGYRDQIETIPLQGRRSSTKSFVAYRWVE